MPDWGLARQEAPLNCIAPLIEETAMLRDVTQVKHLEGYRLWCRFDDGFGGEVDLQPVLSLRGLFEPLRDLNYFAQVRVNPDLGTICWPNDADVDPVVLYALVSGTEIPNYTEAPPTAA